MVFSSVYCINIEARYFHQTTTLFSKRVIEGLRDIALIGSRDGGELRVRGIFFLFLTEEA